jgi:hypothetical protein
MPVRKAKTFLAVLAIVAATLVVVPASPAYAYSGGGAASYANYWWNKRNPDYMTWFDEDCTNFVSQAMHSGGGFSYVGGSNRYDDNQWWARWSIVNGFDWSLSFTVSNDLYYFLLWHSPGGYPEGTASSLSEQEATYTPDNVITGDVIFYDWDSNGSQDHASIQVGWGTDPTSYWYGNYVDQHTSNRYHAFWSLIPYNSQWPSTTISFMHIAYNNY